MASYEIADPHTRLSPLQRQELREASNPIGAYEDADNEIVELERRADRIEADLKRAMREYRRTTDLPEALAEDARRQVVQEAEATLHTVELDSRREMVAIKARARSIHRQLADAAALPSHADLPDSTLQRAQSLAPVIGMELRNAKPAEIARRMKAAVVRNDDAEIVAVALAVNPIIDERQRDDNEDTFDLLALRSGVREIMARFSDDSLDLSIEYADRVASALEDFDHGILKAWQERNDIANPYFSLDLAGGR